MAMMGSVCVFSLIDTIATNLYYWFIMSESATRYNSLCLQINPGMFTIKN